MKRTIQTDLITVSKCEECPFVEYLDTNWVACNNERHPLFGKDSDELARMGVTYDGWKPDHVPEDCPLRETVALVRLDQNLL